MNSSWLLPCNEFIDNTQEKLFEHLRLTFFFRSHKNKRIGFYFLLLINDTNNRLFHFIHCQVTYIFIFVKLR